MRACIGSMFEPGWCSQRRRSSVFCSRDVIEYVKVMDDCFSSGVCVCAVGLSPCSCLKLKRESCRRSNELSRSSRFTSSQPSTLWPRPLCLCAALRQTTFNKAANKWEVGPPLVFIIRFFFSFFSFFVVVVVVLGLEIPVGGSWSVVDFYLENNPRKE